MNKLRVAIRNSGVYFPELSQRINPNWILNFSKVVKCGFTMTEDALEAFKHSSNTVQETIVDHIEEIMMVKQNWVPLVKNWHEPTGESVIDHLITFFGNIFGFEGTKLQCGHTIPNGTFDLSRFNGCPFCGTQFVFGEGGLNLTEKDIDAPTKVLTLWTEKEMRNHFLDILSSPVAMDATVRENFTFLLTQYEITDFSVIKVKEVVALVAKFYWDNKNPKFGELFSTPTDLLRALWFMKTGKAQIVKPKPLVKQMVRISERSTDTTLTESDAKELLKLKYSVAEGNIIANCINNMAMTIPAMMENVNSKREMWLKLIRAAHLNKFAKRVKYTKLHTFIDCLYNKTYDTWAGKVQVQKLKLNTSAMFNLLKQRPGAFSRELFAEMLWCGLKEDGTSEAITEFKKIIDKVPVRLIVTLGQYAKIYFVRHGNRTVKPLGSKAKMINNNKLLLNYTDMQLHQFIVMVEELMLDAIENRFFGKTVDAKTVFIDQQLKWSPLPIGDRAETICDMPVKNTGAKFEVKGDKVRLFLSWGEGLKGPTALDLDLSAMFFNDNSTGGNTVANLYFHSKYHQNRDGELYGQHSGDVRQIPGKKAVVEYVEIDIPAAIKAEHQYVAFTMNAYHGVSPNAFVGWMNSENPLTLPSNYPTNGVPTYFNPSQVQHMVKIEKYESNGLCFGVLDLHAKVITWLELGIDGHTVRSLDAIGVKTMLKKLDSKLSIYNFLMIRANALGQTVVDSPELADEVFGHEFASNAPKLLKLFVD